MAAPLTTEPSGLGQELNPNTLQEESPGGAYHTAGFVCTSFSYTKHQLDLTFFAYHLKL
jgi:hypothetical protein